MPRYFKRHFNKPLIYGMDHSLRNLLFFLLSFCFSLNVNAQNTPDNDSNSIVEHALPFAVHSSKRLSDRSIQEKKEGFFMTGYPRFEYDPIRGISAGGRLNFIQNKDREDPFFNYTAYRYFLAVGGYVFQNTRSGFYMNFDAPYILDTKWRLRVNAFFRNNPDEKYFGTGRQTVEKLQFADKSAGNYGNTRTFEKLDDYQDNLKKAVWDSDRNTFVTDAFYNSFEHTEIFFDFLLERTYYEGRLRLIGGYEALFTAFRDYTGKEVSAYLEDGSTVNAIQRQTLINKDQNGSYWENQNLTGFDESFNFSGIFAAAIVWDTRDFEADPGKGVLLEISNEFSPSILGSDFQFNKSSVHTHWYQTLWNKENTYQRLVFAANFSGSYVSGSEINFIELFDIARQTKRNDILKALGGGYSMRGYRESRFTAPTLLFFNLELRSHLFDFNVLNQNIGVGLSPFYDVGGVWDSPSAVNFKKWRGAPGIGGRFSWNQSTILRVDYARSRESSQFFVGADYIF